MEQGVPIAVAVREPAAAVPPPPLPAAVGFAGNAVSPIPRLDFRLDDRATNYVRDVLGVTVDKPALGRLHPHPVAHIERAVACRLALDSTAARERPLVEVGANALRTAAIAAHAGLRAPRHSLIPAVVPNDGRRRAEALRGRLPCCGCLLQECTHLRPGDDLLFVHSVYYISPDQLVASLVATGGVAFSVQHLFDDAAGHMCDASVHYYIDPTGSLCSTANGDKFVYRHDPMWWVIDGALDCGEYTLVATRLHQVGDTYIYMYHVAPGSGTVGPRLVDYEFGVARNGMSTCSQLDTVLDRRVVNPRFTLYKVPVTSVFIISGMFVFPCGREEVVCCPRGLLGALQTLALNHARNPALYATLIARARRVCAALDIPDEIVARTVPVVAAAALAATEIETAALGRSIALNQASWRLHQGVLGFRPLRFVPGWFIGGVTSTAAGIILPIAIHTPPVAIGVAVAVGASTLYAYTQNRHLTSEADAWAQRRRLDTIATPVAGVAHFRDPGPVLFPGVFTPKTTEYNLAPGAALRVNRAPFLRDDTVDTRVAIGLVGLAFSTATPSAIARTTEAAVNALSVRVLAQVPRENPEAWARLRAVLLDPNRLINQLCERFDAPPADLFEQWVSRFPGNVQNGLTAARADLATTALGDDPNDFRLGMIVKSEKIGLVDEITVSRNDARAVMTPGPRFNAAVGPIIYWASLHRRANRMVHPEAFVCWAVSASAEALGSWFDAMMEHFSRPGEPADIAVIDQKKMDCHQKEGALEFKLVSYTEAGVPVPTAQALRRLAAPRGRVQGMDHVRFRGRQPVQVSGQPITTDGNNTVSEAAMNHSCGEPGPQSYAMVMAGDDLLGIGFRGFFDAPLIIARNLELGLEVDIKVTQDLAEVEFVSLIPYPTSDGTVFGPKIGRHLVRGGWSVGPESSDPYGMSVSLEASVSFIPFLRQFYALHRRLCRQAHPFKPHHRLAVAMHSATPETYEFVHRRYGLAPADEEAFTSLLAGVQSLPAVIDWPRVNELFARDE